MAYKTKVTRAPADISPKVTVPAVLLAVIAVASAILTTGWNSSETATAASAAVVAVVGYITRDKIQV